MPELRKDPITGRWVIVATGRARRPTDFSRDPVKPFGNGFCPFCYGAEEKTPPEVLAFRSNGGPNQPGWSLRVVPNKFPVLEIEGELDRQGDGMFDRMKHSHFCASQALAVVSRILKKQRGIGKILEKSGRDLIGIAGSKALAVSGATLSKRPIRIFSLADSGVESGA